MSESPDVLRPRAEGLVMWMGDAVRTLEWWGGPTEHLTEIIQLLRERDALARVIVAGEQAHLTAGGLAVLPTNALGHPIAQSARVALRDLHEKKS